MHILFTRFPLEAAYGGAEVQTLALMRELQSRGHTLSFLGSCPVLLAEAPKVGCAVTKLVLGKPPVTKGGAISFLWRKFHMARLLQQAYAALPHVDAVCMLSLSEKLLLTPLIPKTKVVWIEHDRVGRWLRRNPWLPALRRASARATIVCVSALSRDVYVRLGFDANRVVAIPNGIDCSRLGSGAINADPSPPLRVGCVSRLSEEKGVDVLLHAIRAIPEASLDVVGVGPQGSYIKYLAQELADMEYADGRIRILGRVKDLGAFYRSLHVLVLPSIDHDPFGLVAGEAMTLGIPVVVTDQCGIASHVQDGLHALVVPAGSATALAHALHSLRDPKHRALLASAGMEHAKRTFSLGAMTDAYEQLLKA